MYLKVNNDDKDDNDDDDVKYILYILFCVIEKYEIFLKSICENWNNIYFPCNLMIRKIK